MHRTLTRKAVFELVSDVLSRHGMNDEGTGILSELLTASHIEGPQSHGLNMLPRYVEELRTGWSNGVAAPKISERKSGWLHVDCDNGYCQIGLSRVFPRLKQVATENGIALLTVANTHHIGALRFDTALLAKDGFIAIAFVNSRAWVVPEGGAKAVFGTNPMSFACPREGAEPIIWDQASSVMSMTDIKLAAQNDEILPHTAGLNTSGNRTCVAKEIVSAEKLLAFGQHKGSAIALMIELLSAALAGGTLSCDEEERVSFGAASSKPGYSMIVIHPDNGVSENFSDQVQKLCQVITVESGGYIPGDRRFDRIQLSQTQGITVDTELLAKLRALLI
jgi:delta1-piperideine-2-carboxylate reductase